MLTMVYGDFDGPMRRKNKANQSQSRLAPRPAMGVENKANRRPSAGNPKH